MPNESERIDEAVLAVLSLTLHEVGPDGGRAWKSIAFEAMDRLHERGLIDDPKSKNKPAWLTPEGGGRGLGGGRFALRRGRVGLIKNANNKAP